MVLNQNHIKKTVSDFFGDKPVKRVWLFGSYVRGEATEESDVDLLVEFESNKRLGLRYLGWNEEMEVLFRKKVQIVSNRGISKFIEPFIEADKVLVYEK